MVQVTKFDGRKEEFDREKIVRTCLRVGISREKAEEIVNKVSSYIYEGISTREIYDYVKKELASFEKKSALIYGLRESVASLDPIAFEIFVKKLLEAHGYKCEHNKIIQGLCVEHQIDVIAKKEIEYLVECKRHNNPHRFCGLGVCLQVQARMEDVEDGFRKALNEEHFGRAWLITNTKFSEHAKKYAKAKNIKLTGWKYPEGESFENMIDSKSIYPVTALKAKRDSIQRMLDHSIVIIQDINEDILSNSGFDVASARRLIEQKNALLRQ